MSSDSKYDLIVTDPPYAFSGAGAEHQLTATVAVVLREAAKRVARGSWMVVFAASSWRSTQYTIDSVRGILEPVRIGHWNKPTARTKTRTPGWAWASVNVIAMRKGKSRNTAPSSLLDHITCPPLTVGRRAQLPEEVARWAVEPFAVPGGTFLDPFAGSGALMEAAAAAGMTAIGYDRQIPTEEDDD
jgi:tRNA G10  N-methylase Trm11